MARCAGLVPRPELSLTTNGIGLARLGDVLAGIAAAAAAGLVPVKVNTVLMRGVNDGEGRDLLRFCLDRGYELRFIEQIPLDAQHGWRRSEMVTAGEIIDGLEPGPADR